MFMLLFVASLCAELIANDKPLLVQYRGSLYVPALKNYSETTFGGPFATAADYQDPWLQKQLDDNGWVLWAPIRFGATTIDFATQTPFPSPPSTRNWLVPMPTAAMCWRVFYTAREYRFCLACC
jgi:microcin C transport system permease protein